MNAHSFENPSRQSAKGVIVFLGIGVYKVVRATIILIAAVLLKYVQGGKSFDFFNPITVSLLLLIPIVLLLIAILKYRNFYFYINNNYFILKKGILNKEEVSISKNKIQNVYIKQNLLQQIINVVSLAIETAGDDKTEIEITALSRDKAMALKDVLLSQNKKTNVGEGESEIVENTNDAVYFKASLQRILLEGISENHLKSFILILGFLVGIYNDAKEFVDRLNLGERFEHYFKLDSESLMGIILLNITMVVILLVISFFFSLVRILIQNYNLTVTKTDKGLEINKGLLNKINLGLVSTRIQNTTVSTNRIKRTLGLYQLTFTQAMVNKKQRQKFKIIALSQQQINELLEKFYPHYSENNTKYKPHNYFIYRVVFLAIIPIIALNAFFLLLPNIFFFLNIPIVVLIGLGIYFTYKKKYYCIDHNYITLGGGGLIDVNTSYLEIAKVQAVSIHQTIFQKRRQLANLKIYSASRSITIPQIPLPTAFDIKNYLLYKVEFEDKDWM